MAQTHLKWGSPSALPGPAKAQSLPSPRSHLSWFEIKNKYLNRRVMQLLTSTYKTNTSCLGRHSNRPKTRTVTFCGFIHCGCINKNYPSGRLKGCALEKKKRLLHAPRTICFSFFPCPHSAEFLPPLTPPENGWWSSEPAMAWRDSDLLCLAEGFYKEKTKPKNQWGGLKWTEFCALWWTVRRLHGSPGRMQVD